MTVLKDVPQFLADYQHNKELWSQLTALTSHIITKTNNDLAAVKYKYTDPSKIGNEAIKQIILENGFGYIKDIMDTIQGFDFEKMFYFVNLIGNLKGTRSGMELVLRLMGFESIITEWWEDPTKPEPWSYKITVIVDNSFVPDLLNTLNKLKLFSENYLYSKISTINLQFGGNDFAQATPIVGGFVRTTWTGSAVAKIGS